MTVGHPPFRAWLDALGLGEHAATFEHNDVGFDAVRLLSDTDMKELGLSLGHRRILQAAVEQLGARAEEAAPAQGERRQITVMFCDLVGSTELSARLDPEDLRNLILAYFSSCCKIIEEHGGFVARLVGDGILAYFGYPAAREDAAECAVRAGLRVVESVGRERLEGKSRVEVRIGLATGVSVISDMVGVGFSELHTVMGKTPNLASRIQSLAAPGTVAIADDTRRLAGGLFIYGDHGLHQVKGFAQPVRVWRVIAESHSAARFDAQHPEHTDCIGRHVQLDAVQAVWEQVLQGQCRVVTLVGEAGIGKSRLLRTVNDRLAAHTGLTVFMQCSPSRTTTPLHPVIDWLRRDAGINAAGSDEDRTRLAVWLGPMATPLDLSLIADFLSVPLAEGQALPPLTPDRQHHLTREVMLRHVERHCETLPALLLVEDAHWMDGATADFLAALFDRMRSRPLMVLITSRSSELRQWADLAHSTELVLEPLPHDEARRLIHEACHGRSLPPAVVDQILAKTDGVPLFVEELTATILESGVLREEGHALVMDGPLPTLDIPSTLRDSLMARLDRLSDIKDVARVASALGREFTFSLLARVSEKPRHRLIAALDRLVEAQLLFQRGTPPDVEYVFKHSLVQQAAYDSQLRSDRRALHARIVQAIETHQPLTARQEPALMAHHCELAGMTSREVDYLYEAGLASTRIVAVREALSHFTHAHAAIDGLKLTPHNARRHIDIILGMMEAGRFAILPSRQAALSEQARSLARMEGVTPDASMTAAILFQDGRAKLYTSRYAEARSIFRELRQLGIAQGSAAIERKPGSAFTMTLCCQGLFNETLEFVNESDIGDYKASGNIIDYLAGLGWVAYASCQTGSVEAAMRCSELAVCEAQQLQSPIYLASAYVWRSHPLMAARRFDEAVADAKRCVELSALHAVPYLGWHGLVFLSLCQCRSGDLDAATQSLAQARELLSQLEDRRWTLLDYLPAIEAEIACFRGDHARALRCADEAIAVAGPIEGHFAEAMAWRAKALSSLRSGADVDQAQACFDDAMRWYERGDARAERAFSALLWAHALHEAAHAPRARRWLDEAQTLARRHGFDLRRCERGAAALL